MTRQANLDRTGNLVKRGVVVSHQYLHFKVVKVRTGRCIAFQLDAFGKTIPYTRLLADCTELSVVRKPQFMATTA